MIQLLHGDENPDVAAWRIFFGASVSFVLAWVAAAALLPFAFSISRNITRTAVVALFYVVAVLMIGAAVALLLLRTRMANLGTKHARTPMFFLIILLWTVPAATYSRCGGFTGILIAGVFVAAIARFLKLVSGFDSEIDVESSLNSVPDLAPRFDRAEGNNIRLVRLTGFVSLAYIGIASQLSGYRTSAFACTALSWFLSAWQFDCRRETKAALLANVRPRLLSHAAAAIGITFLILLAGRRSSAFGSSKTSKSNYEAADDQLHSGIILFSEKKHAVPLVLPRLHGPDNKPVRKLSSSMSIPFSGEYWFSRWPILRPPVASLREEGDPTTINVTLEGFGRLLMQARQSIGRPLDVYCCHSIEVVLHTGDTQPDAVTMELLIADSSRAEHNAQTLGKRSFALPSDVFADTSTKMRGEIFRFQMPRRSAIRSFDSLEVWFYLNPPRAGRSAIASIERFELIP